MIETAGADSRGSGLRQRISLSRSDPGFEDAYGLHQPVRRNRGHAGGAARGEAKGSPTLAICNVKGSMITREAAGTILTHAGPEIGVASTKAFTAQIAALLLLASYLGQIRGKLSPEDARKLMLESLQIPHKMETILQADATGVYDIAGAAIFPSIGFSVSGTRHSLPYRAGRRAEAEGNFVHSCGRLSIGGDEARAERAD